MNKKYQIIVADPPWEIKKVKQSLRKYNKPASMKPIEYSMMSVDDIKILDVNSIADDLCMLFVWTIDKYLYQTPEILKAWGFKYHITMAWDKTNGLAIYGFNRQTEYIVVGLKGNHDVYPKRKTIRTSFMASSPYHSAKPDEFYEMLDVLPYNPRIDLFARTKERMLVINHWDVWGDEVESDIEL